MGFECEWWPSSEASALAALCSGNDALSRQASDGVAESEAANASAAIITKSLHTIVLRRRF